MDAPTPGPTGGASPATGSLPAGSSPPADGPAAIRLSGLTKSYGSQPALQGLDLEVPRGTIYGFLGPNGAGKTTTMRILTGLLHPDGGTVELLGSPWTAADRARLHRVGALVEGPAFYPYLGGRDNLRVVASTGEPPRPGRIDEVLEFVGLSSRAKDPFRTYSLGMKQRLGIAAALLNEPELLLLDEPANGLDPAGIVAVRDLLRRLAGSGTTVFVSSHILPQVQQLADRVGVIDHGRLVREGPLDELLASTGRIRVKVPGDATDRAVAALRPLAPDGDVRLDDNGTGWIRIDLPQDRSGDVNRSLFEAGIVATRLEADSDLEQLFLSLTES
jgi:ABC-2 type transport system ATP-binding protein